MIYFLSLFTGLMLMALQSLLLDVLWPRELGYDILIPLVAYLSLFYPNGKSLLLILFLGLLLDGITGGAMGVYLLTYFWIFAGIQLAVQFLQKDSPVLVFSAIILGVLVEHGFLLAVAAISGNRSAAGADLAGTICGRLLVAGMTGPLLLYALKLSFQRVMSRMTV